MSVLFLYNKILYIFKLINISKVKVKGYIIWVNTVYINKSSIKLFFIIYKLETRKTHSLFMWFTY